MSTMNLNPKPLLIVGLVGIAAYLWMRRANASTAGLRAAPASTVKNYSTPADTALAITSGVVQLLRGITPQASGAQQADARNRELIRSTEQGYYGESAQWAGWTEGVAGVVNAQGALRKWDALQETDGIPAGAPVYDVGSDYTNNPWALMAP